MAAGDVRIGLNGKFLWDAAGGATATTETDNVDDVSLNLTKQFANWTRRGKKWVGNKPTVREAELTFKVLDVEGDAFMAQILSAWDNDTLMAFYPKDDASGQGLDFDGYVGDLKRTEDNEGTIVYEVTVKPSDEKRNPTWT